MASTPSEPTVEFSTFLVSLASSALVQMGYVEPGSLATGEKDLRLARHTIDLIGVLAEKTRGNLDEEEAALLAALQKDLDEKYAAATR